MSMHTGHCFLKERNQDPYMTATMPEGPLSDCKGHYAKATAELATNAEFKV